MKVAIFIFKKKETFQPQTVALQSGSLSSEPQIFNLVLSILLIQRHVLSEGDPLFALFRGAFLLSS